MKRNIMISAAVILTITAISPAFPQKTVTLAYKYPSSLPVAYVKTTRIHQDMDIQGQTMTVDVESMVGCRIISEGSQGNNPGLQVTLDEYSQTIDSPNGRIASNPEEAKGRSFSMSIKPDGRVADLTGAEKIVFTQEGGPSDISGSFLDFFPVLPAGKVSPGFKWTSADTIKNGNDANSQYTVVRSDNIFEGIENVEGMECAKIRLTTEGTTVMNNQVQGMEMTTSGAFTGSEEFYFAISEGYFVKHTANTKMTGQIEMTSPESFTFPVVMTINKNNEIKK